MCRYSGMLFLIGAFTLAGTSVIAARFVSESLGTFTIAACSLLFATIGLLPFCINRLNETLRSMRLSDCFALLLQALCGIFLFRMFLLKGLMSTSAGEAGILTGATPAVTAFMAYIILKEQLNEKRILGLVSTIAGIIMIQGVLILENGFSQKHFVGNLLVLCAAICESLFNVISRISSTGNFLSKSKAFDPVIQTTLVSGIAFLLCMIPALYENPFASLALLDRVGWFALVWYGLFVTALAFILWYAGIKRCEASTAAAFSGMMPFTALVLSILIMKEQPGWHQWFGALMIIAGMVLTSQKR